MLTPLEPRWREIAWEDAFRAARKFPLARSIVWIGIAWGLILELTRRIGRANTIEFFHLLEPFSFDVLLGGKIAQVRHRSITHQGKVLTSTECRTRFSKQSLPNLPG